ncbi:MAG: thioredoxin-dependent thiol peroxidase [Candidatus Aenigmarchaeota archaeon]|nr:thioredoxin-dependent thiol peroxidase [Candidatus Aenigmarchaeota archaeon]
MLSPGMQAPDFALPDAEGRVYKLDDFRGKPLVLYFYPRDMTPGCTKEACGFRDFLPYYRAKGVAVVGVSMDSQDSHRKFAAKHNLPFPLLSDPDGIVCKRYGVYQKKKLYGREYWGIQRTTFLIDPEGKVGDIISRVAVDTHHRDVLARYDRPAKRS